MASNLCLDKLRQSKRRALRLLAGIAKVRDLCPLR
ncbi:hypothetical protein AB4Z22_17660 [Paenibacillus sp. TAF58]